eukprot:766688-Hanusia_phi.AAC.2
MTRTVSATREEPSGWWNERSVRGGGLRFILVRLFMHHPWGGVIEVMIRVGDHNQREGVGFAAVGGKYFLVGTGTVYTGWVSWGWGHIPVEGGTGWGVGKWVGVGKAIQRVGVNLRGGSRDSRRWVIGEGTLGNDQSWEELVQGVRVLEEGYNPISFLGGDVVGLRPV